MHGHAVSEIGILKIAFIGYLRKPKQEICCGKSDWKRKDMASISYRTNARISPEQLAEIFHRSGIRRPVDDLARMEAMLAHANLLITAWDGEQLVGVARALTDFSYCCYLSDLAVDQSHQRRGIGAALVEQVRRAIGEKSMLLLLAAPEAMQYYPKIGFEPVPNGWIIKRAA
ncbi:GNAT family N-acetyltransferase [Noviherbaspirillum sp.]|uniref:GNAT family N-acetyltransferase n=1 Tax=Noviherbaspirillum sp. TaxID=1926288 RepID=UPI002B48C575|nr:GNAT family N-acetyltransferase [Noviherbaspirillum sp.]HJV80102.1 GNAT family N-acetyltransferase [Noviherbaspirillum sp.]